MKSIFDKLNLRPQERRLVVIVGLVLFVVLNIWLVWPYFGEWSKTSNQMRTTQNTLKRYQDEIAKKPTYEKKQKELRSIGELLVGELDMENIVRRQASATPGFQIIQADSRNRVGANTSTNRFFEEQTLTIQFTSGGKELVDFLVGIASQNALIRVREMTVRPDPTQTRLNGNMVFVGNYARKASTNSTRRATAPRRRT
jgi:Tfp pilus assembly protein PilO